MEQLLVLRQYGGINKNVKLHLTGPVYQTLPLFSNLGTVGTYIYAQNISVPGRSAVIHADTQVRNEDVAAHTLTYNVVIVDTNGVAVTNFSGRADDHPAGPDQRADRQFAGHELKFLELGLRLSLRCLYHSVQKASNVLDVVRTRTGFRKTAFTNGMVTLNDRVINIEGSATFDG